MMPISCRNFGQINKRLFGSLCGTVVLVLLLGLCSLPAVAESTSQSGLARDLQSIVDAKVLRVAVTRFDLPSFHVRGPDGALLGPEIDMAQQIGRALGVRVEFVDDAASFDAIVDFVAAGRADIGVSKLSQTYNRLKRVRFSEPYVTLRHALLFNRLAIARAAGGRPPAAVLQKYKGRLGVIAGSAYVDFAHRNFPDATLVEVPNWEAAIASLLSAQVDAVYRSDSRRVLATLIRLLGDFDLAEEAMQEAFRAAVEQWPRDGVPANPVPWLVSAGRFKAIDGIRRRARFEALDADCRSRCLSRDNVNTHQPAARGAESPRPTTSAEHAVELYRKGATIDAVMRELNRARSTAVEYLCHYLRAESPPSVSGWVSDDIYRQVSQVAARVGADKLKPIFDALEGKLTYDEIRIVVTHLTACGGNQ
jgi:ABC-type amino acid transport substrate-binding protein